MSATNKLGALIRLDERQPNPDKAWEELVHWEALFELLREALAELSSLAPEHRVDMLRAWDLATYQWPVYWKGRQTIVQDHKLEAAARSAMVRGIRACGKFRLFMLAAIRAASETASSETVDTLSDVTFASAKPALSGQEAAWVRTCARLLRPERFVSHRASVVVAMTNAATPPVGELAVLELTVLREGENNVCLHPTESVETGDESFPSSMATAWAAAQSLIADGPSNTFRREHRPAAGLGVYDGVWRLRRLLPAPDWKGGAIESVQGRSAGGAAVRGWWHALQGKYPDDPVVVIAEVRQSSNGYKLVGVDAGTDGKELRAKVSAISADLRVDTVVMVDDSMGNRTVAEALLTRLRPDVRQVWLPSDVWA